MSLLVLLAIIVFIYFDFSVLKKQDEELFHKAFSDRSLRICLWGIALTCLTVFGLVLMGLTEQLLVLDDYLSAFFMMIVFPLYLVKRYQFKKTLRKLARPGQPLKENLSLASDAFGVVLLWFLGMIGGIFFIKGIFSSFPHLKSGLGELVLVAAFSFILMIILIHHMLERHPSLSFMDVLGLRRHNQPLIKIVIVPAVIGLSLAYISSIIIFSRQYQPPTPLNQIIEATTSSWIFLAFIVMAVLMAPFFEEIIFRGFFYYMIRKFRGPAFTICFIAVTFGVMHFEQYWGDWAAIAMVTLLGFILTFLRAWTGSSIASIVTHYMYNGAMTIIPVLMIMLSNPVYFEYQVHYPQLDSEAKEELLVESIERYPEHAVSYNDLAWLYAGEEKNLLQALTLVEKALSLDPDQYAYLDTKAEVLYKMGRIEQAVRLAEDLVRKYPANQYLKEQLKKFKKEKK